MYTARVERLDALCDCGPRVVPQRICSHRAMTGHSTFLLSFKVALFFYGSNHSAHSPPCSGGQTPSTTQRARLSALRVHSSWKPGGARLVRTRAQCSPSTISTIRWVKPGARSHAPRALARLSKAHPRITLLGRGRAGAQRAQLTFPGTAPGTTALTHGRHGSVN
ncbi:hypothetical protein NDU88_005749 [Pleurodeles waltl]|uniref:Uncharacterized protein n=1 Tax=Pleurodeles waltl TaxID=8319 RepID=A0AAV7PJ08_PLEWA|nr:hypothetical protein NDU88_005749 [Pleurodeles waltl]